MTDKQKLRCMTCDKLMDAPTFLKLTDYESIGVCKGCLSIIRTFNAFQDEAELDLKELLRTAPDKRISYGSVGTKDYAVVRTPERFLDVDEVWAPEMKPPRKKRTRPKS